jgi:hypothetical protein
MFLLALHQDLALAPKGSSLRSVEIVGGREGGRGYALFDCTPSAQQARFAPIFTNAPEVKA